MADSRADYQETLKQWWENKLIIEKSRSNPDEIKQWNEAYTFFKVEIQVNFEKRPPYLADGLSKDLLDKLKAIIRQGPVETLKFLKEFEKNISNKEDDQLQVEFKINPTDFLQREKQLSPEKKVFVDTIEKLKTHSGNLERIIQKLDYLRPTEAKSATWIKDRVNEFIIDIKEHQQSEEKVSTFLLTIEEFKRRISVAAGTPYTSPTSSAAGAGVTLASAFSALAFGTSAVGGIGGSVAKSAKIPMDSETKKICKDLVKLSDELPKQLSSAARQVTAVRPSESKLVSAVAISEIKEKTESKEFTNSDMQTKCDEFIKDLKESKVSEEDIDEFKNATEKLQTLVTHLANIPKEYKEKHKGKKEVDKSGIVTELANRAKMIIDDYCKMDSKECCARVQGILEGAEDHIRVQREVAHKHHDPMGFKNFKLFKSISNPTSKLVDIIDGLMTACGIQSQAPAAKNSTRRKTP